MTLFEYEPQNPPQIQLRIPLRKLDGTVVGHAGYDAARDENVAVFPRDRDDHYFRKYTGYAVSERVLEDAMNRNIASLYIVERDRCNRLLEFDPVNFVTGHLIAYSDDEDTIIEDTEAIENHTDFNDRQRVVSEDRCRRVWDRSDVVIKLH